MEQPAQTYEEWKVCITTGGGIGTTSAVQERVAVLRNPELPETRRFLELYGSDHLQQVLKWFDRLKKEL